MEDRTSIAEGTTGTLVAVAGEVPGERWGWTRAASGGSGRSVYHATEGDGDVEVLQR